MKWRATLITVALLTTVACGTRLSAPGRPAADSEVIPPAKIMDFSFLYARNCSGCHGTNGMGGAAIGLANPVYLAIADDATTRRITAGGVHGTAMPAFAQHSGGMLTDDQINVIIAGIRSRWAKPDALRGGGADENARALSDVLKGAKGAFRDVAVLNAAAGLMVAGRAKDLKMAVALAQKSIDSGEAEGRLQRLVSVSNA